MLTSSDAHKVSANLQRLIGLHLAYLGRDPVSLFLRRTLVPGLSNRSFTVAVIVVQEGDEIEDIPVDFQSVNDGMTS